jgi:hypothetical protein
MKKISLGIGLGIIAGIIDISPMMAMRLPLAADLSAFLFWVVAGFFIATSALKSNSIFRGILISFLALMPTAIIIGQNNIYDIIPIVFMTLILGGSLGYLIDKYGKN